MKPGTKIKIKLGVVYMWPDWVRHKNDIGIVIPTPSPYLGTYSTRILWPNGETSSVENEHVDIVSSVKINLKELIKCSR